MPEPDMTAGYSALVNGFCDVADICYRAGKLNEATRLLRGGMELIEQAPDGAVDVRDRARLALAFGAILDHRTFYANVDYDLALETAGRAEVLAGMANSTRLSDDAADLAGLIRYNRALNLGEGSYDEALMFFRRALVIREGLNDTHGIAESLFHVGLIHERLGQTDEARKQYEAALETATAHGHKLEESYARRHLAGIAQEAGDLGTALAGFQRSLALREELGYRILLPLSLLAVGDVLLAQNNDAAALEYFQRANDLAETMDIPLAQLFVLLSLGATKQKAGEIEVARDHYQRALVLAEANSFNEGITAAREALAALP